MTYHIFILFSIKIYKIIIYGGGKTMAAGPDASSAASSEQAAASASSEPSSGAAADSAGRLSLPTSFSKAGPLQPGRIIRPQRQTNIMWPLPKQLPGKREPLPKPLPRKGGGGAAKPLSKAWLKRRIPLHEKWPVLGDLHCNLDVIFDDLHGIERPAKRRRLLAEASQSYIHIMYIIHIVYNLFP